MLISAENPSLKPDRTAKINRIVMMAKGKTNANPTACRPIDVFPVIKTLSPSL